MRLQGRSGSCSVRSVRGRAIDGSLARQVPLASETTAIVEKAFQRELDAFFFDVRQVSAIRRLADLNMAAIRAHLDRRGFFGFLGAWERTNRSELVATVREAFAR